MARIVCLANSRKGGDRCIAGIDLVTEELVRPVSSLPDGRITRRMRLIGGEEPELLDILEIPLEETGPNYDHQRENRLVAEGDWKKVGEFDVDDLYQYCEDVTPLLHSTSDRAQWDDLTSLPSAEQKSLQLIYVEDLQVYTKYNVFSRKDQVRAVFTYGTARYDIVVTDLEIEGMVKDDLEIGSECILLVSIGGPYEVGGVKYAFKFAAGFVEYELVL